MTRATKVVKLNDGISKYDLQLTDPKPYDIVIPIMGITGSGKSTLVNTLTDGKADLPVGHDIDPCTEVVQHAIATHPKDPSHRIIFLDTPGLDSTTCPDKAILERIVAWLNKSYPDGMKLAGIIFLYEISQTRDLSFARRNLDQFDRLCGERATKNVILATTKWSTPPKEKEMKRESDLEGPEHWGQLIRHGSRMRRLGDTTSGSAWMLVSLSLADAFTFDTDKIRDDVERMKESLKKKSDGPRLMATLEGLLVSQNAMALELKEDGGLGDVLWNRLVENNACIRDTLRQIGSKVPLSQKIIAFFKFYH